MTKIIPDRAPSTLYLYVLVRTDMPSQKEGKAAAQSTHAGNQFTDKHVIRPLLASKTPDTDVMEWREEADGFGTTITLDASSLRDMEAVVNAAQKLGFKADLVYDPEYPYVVNREIMPLIDAANHTADPVRLPSGDFACFRRECTTAYVFGDKEKLAVLLRRFKLLNND